MTGDTPPTSSAKAPSAAAAATAAAAEEALARLADLARHALQSQVSLAKQSADLTRAALSGDMDRTSAGKAYVDAVSREGARYWRAVSELGVDYAADLIALGNRLSTTVLREAREAGRSGARPTNGAAEGSGQSTFTRTSDGSTSTFERRGEAEEPGGAERHVEAERRDEGDRRAHISLVGPVGGRAEGTITVVNRHPRPRRILLSASDVVDPDGAAIATLDIAPARVTVPSGQERSVSLGIDLEKSSFLAGTRYSCTVDVSGGDEATVEVTIDVGP